ncbi:hypothetical protein MCOR25_010577 [Pyricularia grisea]|nr:hypothetical protein MCOR25_010577 [Pyricularia grisea]
MVAELHQYKLEKEGVITREQRKQAEQAARAKAVATKQMAKQGQAIGYPVLQQYPY